jgi:hypothetical protein
VKLPASKLVMLLPLYHCGGWRTMSLNALAHVRSTPNAIAKGRNFSNISGVFTTRA